MINVVLCLLKVFQMSYIRLIIEVEGAYARGIVILEEWEEDIYFIFRPGANSTRALIEP